MNDAELINFEDRIYTNPQVGLDESNAFIENLRQTQAADTSRIDQQTYALGSQVPSNLGGLSGSEATFAERYQTPQTEQMIADLKATAQTQALNQALENTLAQWKNRYQQAYRNARAKALTPTPASPEGGVNTSNYQTAGEYSGATPGIGGKYTVTDPAGILHIVDMETGEEEIVGASNAKQDKSYSNPLLNALKIFGAK